MSAKWIIDSVVRQTTVLIAHLSTSTGVRAPLAHVANQIFLDLVHELEAQGLGKKVIADMFGLALRSYQLKVQRLSESATEPNRSLWEAVLAFIREQNLVARAEILQRFRLDDEDIVRGILHDLVETGFVFRMGRGHRTTYRAASEEELAEHMRVDPHVAADALTWVAIYHNAPISRLRLAETIAVEEDELDGALQRLVGDGRVRCDESTGEPVYSCDVYVIPMHEPEGWAAAVFDHYQVMVGALCAKLRRHETTAFPDDVIGGSTYSFDLWDGHPFSDRVLGLLRNYREQLTELRNEVTAYNEAHGRPDEERTKVKFYLGQNTIRPDELDVEVS